MSVFLVIGAEIGMSPLVFSHSMLLIEGYIHSYSGYVTGEAT